MISNITASNCTRCHSLHSCGRGDLYEEVSGDNTQPCRTNITITKDKDTGAMDSEKKKAKKDKKRESSSGKEGKEKEVAAADVVKTLDTGADFMIEPESSAPKIDTSKWPLLLKNYDRLHVSASALLPLRAWVSHHCMLPPSVHHLHMQLTLTHSLTHSLPKSALYSH